MPSASPSTSLPPVARPIDPTTEGVGMDWQMPVAGSWLRKAPVEKFYIEINGRVPGVLILESDPQPELRGTRRLLAGG